MQFVRFHLRLPTFKKQKKRFKASLILPTCTLTRSSSSTVDRNPSNRCNEIKGQEESPEFVDPPENLRGNSRRSSVQAGAPSSPAEESRTRTSATELEGVGFCGTCQEIDGEMTRVSVDRVRLPGASVAVLKYSVEPYTDFRRSIMEMVGNRLERNLVVDLDYLEELVICYLELNENNCLQYITTAFFDVLVELFGFEGFSHYIHEKTK